ILMLGCQLGLLVDALASLRMLFRVAVFATSLGLIFVLPGAGPRQPARGWALGAILLVAIRLFHPYTNPYMAGFAQLPPSVAILAPLFWVGRMPITATIFRRLLLLLWLFHSLSALFGLLQVYYPGRFQPHLSAVVESQGQWYLEDLKIVLASGERVFRPMG